MPTSITDMNVSLVSTPIRTDLTNASSIKKKKSSYHCKKKLKVFNYSTLLQIARFDSFLPVKHQSPAISAHSLAVRHDTHDDKSIILGPEICYLGQKMMSRWRAVMGSTFLSPALKATSASHWAGRYSSCTRSCFFVFFLVEDCFPSQFLDPFSSSHRVTVPDSSQPPPRPAGWHVPGGL